MRPKQTKWAGEGLERSCQGTVAGWITSARPDSGVELFKAWFAGKAYRKHRHDAYAVCVTDCGVQVFDYRGSVHASTPGQVTVLYPDEIHDGRAGTSDGFGYRIVYVEPSLLAEAVQVLRGRPVPLPFVEPVSTNPRLSCVIEEAFRTPPDALASTRRGRNSPAGGSGRAAVGSYGGRLRNNTRARIRSPQLIGETAAGSSRIDSGPRTAGRRTAWERTDCCRGCDRPTRYMPGWSCH